MSVRSWARLAAAMTTLVVCAVAQPARAVIFTVKGAGNAGPNTLRQAIIDSNAAPGPDVIVFDPAFFPAGPYSILLETALPAITGDLMIIGPGVDVVWVETKDLSLQFPIFTISGNVNVEISRLRILRGRGVNGGGVVASGGMLTLTDCVIESCTASGSGAGVYMRGMGDATLKLERTQVLSNTSGDHGGGVYLYRDTGKATLILTDATIGRNSINSGVAGRQGGGVYVAGPIGPHTITGVRSTIYNNGVPASGTGGGVHLEAVGGALTLTNCTISGNNSGPGSALDIDNTLASLLNCTVTQNTTLGIANAGAGCVRATGATTVEVRNTILSGNVSGGTLRDLADGQVITGNNNLIGVGGSLSNGVKGNIVGVTDPRLAPLATIGGFSPVFHLRPESSALDAGSNMDAPSTDQRGQPRPADGDNDGEETTDIGAFETQMFLVTTAADAGAGSLREAIIENNTSGGGFVRFKIPGGRSVAPSAPLSPIMLATPYPTIARPVFIDGWSQVSPAYNGPPVIEIDGLNAGPGVGLDITGWDCIIRGLAINRFGGTDVGGNGGAGVGITIRSNQALRNWIYGCYIGLAPDGTTARGNGDTGVYIGVTANNTMLGTNGDGANDAAELNVISGQDVGGRKVGVYIQSNGNILANNYVGTNASGLGAVPNGRHGVCVDLGATSNRLGASAFSPFPAAERNLISGNLSSGVRIAGQASGTLVAGNLIGTDITGQAALPNGLGVEIEDSATSTIGGGGAVLRNIISGNTGGGVRIVGPNAMLNVVNANYIGLMADGITALGNGGFGVSLEAGALLNRIGSSGGVVGVVNVISGNSGPGVRLLDFETTDNDILGNFIGTDALGTTARPNSGAGIALDGAMRTDLGGTGNRRNVIAANGGHGISLGGDACINNTIINNLIGVALNGAAMGNAGSGVRLSGGAVNTLIGGTLTGAANTIANNLQGGVVIIGSSAFDNAIVGNSIHSNTGLGIDLGNDGVTANGGAGVVRTGPNRLQNYPIIVQATSAGQITASLVARANADFRVEFFSSASPDPSGSGEGRTYLGAVQTETDAMGVAPPIAFSFAPGSEKWITATATELFSQPSLLGSFTLGSGAPLSTSEFSPARVLNTNPTATPQNVTTAEDTDLTITLTGTDVDPDPLTFKITSLPTNGSLLQNGTMTPITTVPTTVTDSGGRVIFRPAANAFGNPYATFGFVANDGTADSTSATVTVTVTPVADTPNITDASTLEDVQTTSGLVVGRNPADGAEVSHFKVIGVTGGSLFLNDGVTAVPVNSFITAAQGAAGLKFTPALNSLVTGTVTVRASIGNSDSGLGGKPATGSITITAAADTPSVTDASTLEDTLSNGGLVITRNTADGAEVTHFKITGITNGTLFLNDGTTPVANGAFVTAAQGAAGLRFLPSPNFFGNGTVNVQASTSASDPGLGGSQVLATIVVSPVADTPSITDSSTLEDVQTTSGLVVTRAAVDGPEVTHFKVVGVTGGSLFLNDGVTAVPVNTFITAAQSAAGLKFTPAPNSIATGTVSVRASLSGLDAGLGGGTATANITITAIADTPSVTDSSTLEDTQSTTGLVITRNAADGNEVTHFRITGITNGTLFQNDGVTPIGDGAFITAAQGAAGLKFTPTANFFGNGTFNVQASTSGTIAGLGGAPVLATIVVSPVADTPSITDSSTLEDVQTTSGLIVSRAAVDGPEVTHFKVVGVTGGSLFLNDGVTAVPVNAFITAAQGAAGLKFTPAPNSIATGTVSVRASLNATDPGLGGGTATANITITAVADTPSVTDSSTLEDTQSTTGLVISRNAADGNEVTHFRITGITNGTLFLNDGTTAVVDGSFVTAAQGAAGLKFTPTANFFGNGTFNVQASTSGDIAGLGGSQVLATIVVSPVADTPSITDSSTLEDVQTTSGLVVARAAVDGPEVTHFKIVGVTNGSLFLNDGVTPVPVNAFITAAQGAAGLKFTPAPNSITTGTVSVRASLSGLDAGLGGGTATANITITAVADTPSVSGTTTPEDTLSSTGLVITRNVADGAEVTHFKITGITNGTLFLNDGTTPVANGSFVTAAQGAAGLRFLPSPDYHGPASFGVQAATGANDAALGGSVVMAAITVTPVADTPSITDSSTLEDVQTTSGLIVSRAAVDGPEVTHFKVVGVTGGSLFLNDGVTAVPVNTFITAAQGAAGLKFTPAPNSIATGTVSVRASLSGLDAGLGGGTATANITITAVADTPSVTDSSTLEDTQSTTGLVITRNAADGNEVTHFRITGITNGTLFQNDGVTPIGDGAFITAAQGAAGLKFTPTANFFGNGTFNVQASTTGTIAGLGGAPVLATIVVSPVADTPSITDASTTENVQTSSGLIAARNPVDGAEVTHFKITAVNNGSLFLNDGVTPVNVNSFILVAQGTAGLRFTPAPGFFGDTTISIRASVSGADAGLGGGTATATIHVTPNAKTPNITNAATLEDTISTSGLVITRSIINGPEVTHFKVVSFTNGRLFKSDGSTELFAGNFITAAEGGAGLRFLPELDYFGPAQVLLASSTSASDAGISNPPAVGAVLVMPVNDKPSFTGSNPPQTFQNAAPAPVSLAGWATFSPGPPNEIAQTVLEYQVSNIGTPSLFAVQPAVSPSGVLTYTAAPSAFGTSTFTVRVKDDGGTDNFGVDTSDPQTFTITVGAVNQPPSFTANNPPAVIEGTGAKSVPFVTGFSLGPPSESGQQVLQYIVDQVSNPGLFAAAPAVSIAGVLNYTPATTGFGTSTFRVRLQDNGGLLNGGNDTSPPQVFTIIVRPAAVCRDVTIDARTVCVSRKVPLSALHATPSTPGPGATQTIVTDRDLNLDFPIGVTPVLVTAMYSDGLQSSCVAQVTVLGGDCDGNGIPDTCDIGAGGTTDCNLDGIPDACQCVYDNGPAPPAVPMPNGVLSHHGGAVAVPVQAAEDFFLPGCGVYKIFGFKGTLVNNSLPGFRKARVEFYDDCNGCPVGAPFATYTTTTVLSATPLGNGYDLVTYSFEFCAMPLYLQGGKTYWVSLYGLTDGQGTDESYWVSVTAQAAPNTVLGTPPKKTNLNTPGVRSPWTDLDQCCLDCVNLTFCVRGEFCQLYWDNGDAGTTGVGGPPSGANGGQLPPPRAADNFVVKNCESAQVCMIETCVYTNCPGPIPGFVEVYADECGKPGSTPLFRSTVVRTIPLGFSYLHTDGKLYPAYRFIFENLNWLLAGGRNYWVSSGVDVTVLNARSFFCGVDDCRRVCASRFGPAKGLRQPGSPLPPQWEPLGWDLSFKVYVRADMMVLPLTQTPTDRPEAVLAAPTVCAGDFNADGAVTTQDLFDFFAAYFSGCF